MKISEEMLKELRHLIPELGRAKDCHVNVQLNLTYYDHSDTYTECGELWIAEEENLIDFSNGQALIAYIKAEIMSHKGSGPDA